MVWIRKGYCCQCGDCCSNRTLMSQESFNNLMKACNQIEKEQPRLTKEAEITKRELLEGRNNQCKSLENRKGGKKICRQYNNRPDFCKEFPGSPGDIENLSKCTYYFEKQ